MEHLPQDPGERDHFIERALSDTGFFARNILGMDTDRTDNNVATSEIGKGGIRATGPHQEMVRFIDDDSVKHGALWAPRYSYKSSVIKAFITRKILAHPNISILLVMHDIEDAKERSAQIRDSLLENEIIKEMFGDLQGSVWQRERWTTSIRTDKTIQQPTLSVASPQKAKAGGRFNLIIFDDVVPETAPESEALRKLGIRCVEKALNLRARGTRYLLVGTPYHPEDANHWVIDRGWKACTHLDVGCDIIVGEDGNLALKGKGRWPNLPKSFLEVYLAGGMTYELFMSQFKLKVVSGLTQAFQATQFMPEMRSERHQDLTGYLLTDVAPSGSPKGDFNVLMYVGVDDRNRVYIFDLELGFWKMHEFCERYLRMLARWNGQMTHRAELWEDSLNFHSYWQYIGMQARKTGQRVNAERVKRNQHEKGKDERIAGLALRFQAREVHVMDSMPRTWSTGTELRPLWDPEGDQDPESGKVVPSGDLVDWFTRFPHHPKKDVPDTLALVDAMDRKTESPLCYWIRPSRRRAPDSPKRKLVQDTTRPSRRGYGQRFYDRCHGR